MLQRRVLTREPVVPAVVVAVMCQVLPSLRLKSSRAPRSPADAVIPVEPAAPVRGADAASAELPPIAGTYAVDVSTRHGALCVSCGLPIPAATLRYAVLVDGPGDFKIPRYSHAACFRTSFLRTYPGAFARLEAVGGLSKLPDDDIALTKVLRMASRDERLALDLVLPASALATWREQRNMFTRLVGSLAANSGPVLRNFVRNALESGGGTGRKNTPVPARFRTTIDKTGVKDLARIAADLICYGVPRGCDGCSTGPVLPTTAPLQYRCRGYVDEFTACNDARAAREAASRLKIPDLRSVHNIDLSKVEGLEAFLKKKPDCFGIGAALDEGIAKHKGIAVAELHAAAADADRVAATAFAGRVFVFEAPKAAKLYKPKIEAAGGSIATAVQAAKTAVEAAGPPIVVVKGAPESGNPPSNETSEFLDSARAALRSQEPIAATTAYMDACLLGDGRVLGPVEGKSTLFQLPEGHLRDQSSSLRIAERAPASATSAKKKDDKGAPASVTFTDGVMVDAEYECAATASVIRDASTLRDPLSVQLHNVDVATGTNSFYILQALKVDGTYVLYRRWGRVGDDFRSGKTAKTFRSQDAAEQMFEKLFEERTGNQWADRATFTKVPGRYNYVHTDASAELPSSATTAAGSSSKSLAPGGAGPSSIIYAPATLGLLKLLFDQDVMQSTMATMEIDVKKMPLAHLSTRQLDEGNKALVELSRLVSPKGQKNATKATTKKRIVSLTNRFYTHVPHTLDVSLPFEAHLIDSPDKVGAKSQLLQDLRDMIFTRTIIKADGSAGALYKQLNSDLTWVAPASDDFKLVDRYATNTQARTHSSYKVMNVWRADRHGEDERFRKNKITHANVQLLWHGSRLTNWVRILAEGLRIAPPEAPSTGYMFGKGIYFADMFSKSANYCFTRTTGAPGILCLCEVALGNSEERTRSDYITHLPSGMHHSCFARGTTHPDPSECLKNWGDFKAQVPLGRGCNSGIGSSSLLYNEFIVYDVSQVRVRYLVEVESG